MNEAVMERAVLHYRSYLRGLRPREGDACGCGYDHSQDWAVFGIKLDSPSLYELDLARRSHRWPEVNKIMASFFQAFAQEVTIAEGKILKAAGLPKLNTVRDSLEDDKAQQIQDQRTWTSRFAEMFVSKQIDPEIERQLDLIFDIWIQNLIGSGVLPDSLEDLPVYHYHTLNSFAIGLQKALGDIQEELDDALLAPANYSNAYLAKLTNDGMTRITTKLFDHYRGLVTAILSEGVAAGDNPLQIAREIHQRVGEGQLWYWNRLARSESAIALDAAFVSEARENGVEHEQWSTASNPCPICAPLDGLIWRTGEGPRVVYDTHPHCLCTKYAYFGEPDKVQPAAAQSLPYL